MLRTGFRFSSGGQQLRFVGFASGFELHDALHETFRRAFEPRARDGYDGLRPYGPYLRTIARNVVLQTFRAREVVVLDESKPPQTDVHTLSGERLNPEANLARKQLRTKVQAFLGQLPAGDRRLLELRFVEGRSQREVAEALGIGRQRIRTREIKLRRALLAYLQATVGQDVYTSSLLALMASSPFLRTALHNVGEVLR